VSDGHDRAWLSLVRTALAEQLSRLTGVWQDDGQMVVGPGTVAVRPELRHGGGPGHVDLGFLLNRNREDAPVLWDCVAGRGQDLKAAAELACSIWARTTAPAILELLTQKGELADHAHGDDGCGLLGWHSIHGPILGYGRQDATDLQRWCLEHPLVPLLREPLAAALAPGRLHGVKFLLGAFGHESLAEVRIDGALDEASSSALLACPWPKTPTRVVRCYVIFIHAE